MRSGRSLRSPVLALALVALVTGCVGGLSVEETPGADYSAYRTWDWLPPSPRDAHDDPALEAQLTALLERHLRERGYERAAEGVAPDFHVAYRVSVRSTVRVRSEPEGQEQFHTAESVGQGGFLIDRPSALYEVPYADALVVVGISDGRTGEVVWQAERREEVRGGYTNHLDDALADILRRWPMARTSPTES